MNIISESKNNNEVPLGWCRLNIANNVTETILYFSFVSSDYGRDKIDIILQLNKS